MGGFACQERLPMTCTCTKDMSAWLALPMFHRIGLSVAPVAEDILLLPS